MACTCASGELFLLSNIALKALLDISINSFMMGSGGNSLSRLNVEANLIALRCSFLPKRSCIKPAKKLALKYEFPYQSLKSVKLVEQCT